MEKTELMKNYETENGLEAVNSVYTGWDGLDVRSNDDYITWLESELIKARAKAEAYDRLMSGGKKTLKEWANILGKPVAIDAENRLWWFPKKPEIGLVTWIWYDGHFGCFGEELPKNLIDYTGNWKDSLTPPDEWEEK